MDYTEYSQDRVKELMAHSKKEFSDIPDYLMFLMCVDYHCREEVKMDVPDSEELKKRYKL
jgi:hypothetical protein